MSDAKTVLAERTRGGWCAFCDWEIADGKHEFELCPVDALASTLDRAERAEAQVEALEGEQRTREARYLDHTAFLEQALGIVEARVEALAGLLREARSAIAGVENKAVFGVGGRGMTHWYLVEELVWRIDAALATGEHVKSDIGENRGQDDE